MLESISDRELIARLQQLRARERETTVEILEHLCEVERRALYLRLGYPSLFAYCVGHLRYSDSAAGRRVQAARCLRRFPKAAQLPRDGEINLMTLGLVASILTDELLERIRGKTQREVETLASTFRPPVKLRDRVQPVNVPVPATPAPAGPPASEPPTVASPPLLVNQSTNSQSGSEKSPSVVTVRKLYIQFLADEHFMERYREACALLSNRIAKPSFEAVFKALLDEFIARHSPREKQARRKQRSAVKARPAANRTARAAIPASTRDAVFIRDRQQCTYVGATGKRCGETRHLHIDHINPVTRGGTNDVSNLRLLCARHNQFEAKRILGESLMDQYRPGDRVTPVGRCGGTPTSRGSMMYHKSGGAGHEGDHGG